MLASTTQTLPSLETNLHKILARKIQDSEEMTFRKAKLLTKAYYKLLRESTKPLVDPQVQVRLYHAVVASSQVVYSSTVVDSPICRSSVSATICRP